MNFDNILAVVIPHLIVIQISGFEVRLDGVDICAQVAGWRLPDLEVWTLLSVLPLGGVECANDFVVLGFFICVTHEI